MPTPDFRIRRIEPGIWLIEAYCTDGPYPVSTHPSKDEAEVEVLRLLQKESK